MKIKPLQILLITMILIIVAMFGFLAWKNFPEATFTELYFTHPDSLPDSASIGKENSFSFTIRNLEGKVMEYPYIVRVSDNVIRQGNVRIEDEGNKTIGVSFSIDDNSSEKRLITVELPSKGQKIQFWVNIR